MTRLRKKLYKRITLISLISFISVMLFSPFVSYASSGVMQQFLYEKNNVIGYFEHKGPIKGSPYDGQIDITGTEVDDKWRMEQVTLYEQSDYADKKPNGHYYRTVGYATMLVKLEGGKFIPISHGDINDHNSWVYRDVLSISKEEASKMSDLIRKNGWSFNEKYVTSQTLSRSYFYNAFGVNDETLNQADYMLLLLAHNIQQ